LLDAIAEPPEAVFCDRGEDRLAIGEVVIRRLVTDPGASRDLAQTEAADALLPEELHAGAEDSLAEVFGSGGRRDGHHRIPESAAWLDSVKCLTGNTLSFTATIGFIALMGIEAKNSILLVDFTNQLREQGMGMDEAIQKAGGARFVPILPTTTTAIGGLVPLILERSSLYSPLALVILGGLISFDAADARGDAGALRATGAGSGGRGGGRRRGGGGGGGVGHPARARAGLASGAGSGRMAAAAASRGRFLGGSELVWLRRCCGIRVPPCSLRAFALFLVKAREDAWT
jgi:hypothetical protein